MACAKPDPDCMSLPSTLWKKTNKKRRNILVHYRDRVVPPPLTTIHAKSDHNSVISSVCDTIFEDEDGADDPMIDLYPILIQKRPSPVGAHRLSTRHAPQRANDADSVAPTLDLSETSSVDLSTSELRNNFIRQQVDELLLSDNTVSFRRDDDARTEEISLSLRDNEIRTAASSRPHREWVVDEEEQNDTDDDFLTPLERDLLPLQRTRTLSTEPTSEPSIRSTMGVPVVDAESVALVSSLSYVKEEQQHESKQLIS